jgi:hypothetical protein
MALSTKDPFEDNARHLRGFPDHVLLDIARNDAAQKPYRLLAVEILQVRKSPLIKHPDIQFLVSELEIELDGIVFEHPAPGPGPLTASVTTETMFADGPIVSETLGGEEGGAGEGVVGTLTETSSEESDVQKTDPPVPPKPKPTRSRKKKDVVDAPKQ